MLMQLRTEAPFDGILSASIAGAEPKVYTQVSDSARMLAVLKEYLADYNAISKKPMQLVLFQFALEHISRICRIITSPGVNPE